MNDTIIIIAPIEDIHSRVVAQYIETDFNCQALIWDNANFPLTDQIYFGIDNDHLDFALYHKHKKYGLQNIRSIWVRRPRTFTISKSISDDHIQRFCENESRILFKGGLESVPIPIINNIYNDIKASNKPLQLRVAKECGLGIPRTVMTNDKNDVITFKKNSLQGCIYKTFGPLYMGVAETRILSEEDLGHLDKLIHAPIIVQDKINGQDIRVNVFGKNVTAASVSSDNGNQLDWRFDLSSKWHEHSLPTEI